MPISYNILINEPEFIGAISTTIWAKIAQRRLIGKLREAIPHGYDRVVEFLDLYDIRGQFYSHEYIRQQYEVLDVLFLNRNLNADIGDLDSYDLLQHEINIASTYPHIKASIDLMTSFQEVG